jgi:hypothetical protein
MKYRQFITSKRVLRSTPPHSAFEQPHGHRTGIAAYRPLSPTTALGCDSQLLIYIKASSFACIGVTFAVTNYYCPFCILVRRSK